VVIIYAYGLMRVGRLQTKEVNLRKNCRFWWILFNVY